MCDWRQQPWPSSLQLIGSKGLGGAERWFQRFCSALAEGQKPAAMGIRQGSALDTVYAKAPSAELPCHRLPFWSVWDPLSQAAVSRLVRRMRPQIVQTYMGRATRLLRRPSGFSGSWPRHIARLGGYYRLEPYRHADAWIGNTRQLCDWMITQGLPAQRVHHIYNFIDPVPKLAAEEGVRLRDGLELHGDECILVALGRFVPVKGHADLLEALARLPSTIDGRRWRLLLLGEGPLEASLRSQSQGLGIAERLRWLGWRSDPHRYMQLADLVVFPSREEETLGNVILEAWASARPLVTTNFRGAREIAHHGEDAWCVPCADPKALAQGILRLLRDTDLAAALVQRGRERVEGEFSRATIMQQYWALYTDLANG